MSKALIASMTGAAVATALVFAVVVIHHQIRPSTHPLATTPAAGRNDDSSTLQSQQPVPAASETSYQDSPVTDKTAEPLAYAAASDEPAALETLEKQAKQGSPAAEYGMGLYLLTNAQRLNPTSKCADTYWDEHHLPERWKREMNKLDQLTPADKLAESREFTKSCLEAISWLEKAAVSGDHSAQAELGSQYLSAINVMNVMVHRFGRANNIPSASMDKEMNRGGYLKGMCSEGLRWLNLAVAAHDPNAESSLATNYLIGLVERGCLPGNKLKALEWHEKAYYDGRLSSSAMAAALNWDRGQFSDARKWIAKAEKEGVNDSETAWDIVNYYKGFDTNAEKAESWQERALQLDAEKEAKYPVFKLIHQKWTEKGESDGSTAK